tara:strand:- start:380 stop:541 length:162 start_codon:yes stop_codon:yes gene_type:complete
MFFDDRNRGKAAEWKEKISTAGRDGEGEVAYGFVETRDRSDGSSYRTLSPLFY